METPCGMCQGGQPPTVTGSATIVYHMLQHLTISPKERMLRMPLLFIEYPKCTTCQRAKKWLEARGVGFQARHIVEAPPTREELAAWAERLPVKRLWNTSGQKYRQLGLSQKLPGMSLDEQLDLLCTDGMLVKRPVLAGEGFVLTGFKEAEWAAALGKD